RHAWITLGLHALTGILLFPYVNFYLSGLYVIASMGKHPAALTLLQAVDTVVRALTSDSLALFAVLAVVALGAWRQTLFKLAFIWLWLPVLVVLAAHALIIPVFVGPRYLLFVWPAMAILIALGIESLNRRIATITMSVIALVGAGQVVNNFTAHFPGVLGDQPW